MWINRQRWDEITGLQTNESESYLSPNTGEQSSDTYVHSRNRVRGTLEGVREVLTYIYGADENDIININRLPRIRNRDGALVNQSYALIGGGDQDTLIISLRGLRRGVSYRFIANGDIGQDTLRLNPGQWQSPRIGINRRGDNPNYIEPGERYLRLSSTVGDARIDIYDIETIGIGSSTYSSFESLAQSFSS